MSSTILFEIVLARHNQTLNISTTHKEIEEVFAAQIPKHDPRTLIALNSDDQEAFGKAFSCLFGLQEMNNRVTNVSNTVKITVWKLCWKDIWKWFKYSCRVFFVVFGAPNCAICDSMLDQLVRAGLPSHGFDQNRGVHVTLSDHILLQRR